MNTFQPMLIPELVLLALIAATWRPIVSKEQGGVRTLRVFGFMLPALGLIVGIALFLIVVPFGSLSDLYDRMRGTYWFRPVDLFFLLGTLATGILPFCGLLMSIVTRKASLKMRLAVCAWSSLGLCIFFGHFVLFVNSFH